MRRFWLLILFSTTLSLVLGGFTYLAMFASIPYQQPTPKMALRDRDGLKLKIGDSYCIVVPDHDWTLKLGRGWYGIQGYPFSTRLVLGARSAMIPAPFPLVSRLGLALFTAVGVFSCYRAFSGYRVSRSGNERTEAHAG